MQIRIKNDRTGRVLGQYQCVGVVPAVGDTILISSPRCDSDEMYVVENVTHCIMLDGSDSKEMYAEVSVSERNVDQ